MIRYSIHSKGSSFDRHGQICTCRIRLIERNSMVYVSDFDISKFPSLLSHPQLVFSPKQRNTLQLKSDGRTNHFCRGINNVDLHWEILNSLIWMDR